MAETGEALKIEYDDTNDVLWVMTEGEHGEVIALPGTSATILVSENRDRIAGVVFDHYTNMLLAGANGAADQAGNQLLRQLGIRVMESVLPPLFARSGPAIKDAVSLWLEEAAKQDGEPLPG